jgi:hypothetical protein
LAVDQLPLIEPTGAEIPALAMAFVKRSEAMLRNARVAEARGWEAVARRAHEAAAVLADEAECLAMLFEFEILGGVHA